MSKYSKLLFGILTVAGIVILAIFFLVIYWSQTWSVELVTVDKLLGDSQFDHSGRNSFFYYTLIPGTALLMVGIPGIIVQSIKKHRTVFAILTATLIPMLVFGTFVMLCIANSNFPTERLAITNFRVDSTNPLTFSLNAKSLFYYQIDVDGAFVKADNQTIVANIHSSIVETDQPDVEGGHIMTMDFLYNLPPGSEQTLTFDFNTTLPSGNYTFWLSTWRQGGFVSFNFAI